MTLEMKSHCEKCGRLLSQQEEAYICSYECTFCPECTATLGPACPNCGGELIRRPQREDKQV
jgi:hypothetical protein